MNWNITKLDFLTQYDVITGISMVAVNAQSGVSYTLNPKAISLNNGILSMVIDDFNIVLTEGTYNTWNITVKTTINYSREYTIGTCTIQSSQSSTDITYFGVNIIYLNVDWDGYCDITPIGKESSKHVINPTEMHQGVSKSKFSEYVGNEKNAILHKQLI